MKMKKKYGELILDFYSNVNLKLKEMFFAVINHVRKAVLSAVDFIA